MRIKFLLLSIFVALIAFTSCKKTTVNSAATAFSNDISANVDGLFFSADSGTYFEIYKDEWNGKIYNEINFESYDSKGNDFYIWLGTTDSIFTNKTYGAYGDSTSFAGIEFDSTGGNEYWSNTVLNPATITITSSIASGLKATFNGTAYYDGDTTQTGSNKKAITNDKFSLSY